MNNQEVFLLLIQTAVLSPGPMMGDPVDIVAEASFVDKFDLAYSNPVRLAQQAREFIESYRKGDTPDLLKNRTLAGLDEW